MGISNWFKQTPTKFPWSHNYGLYGPEMDEEIDTSEEDETKDTNITTDQGMKEINTNPHDYYIDRAGLRSKNLDVYFEIKPYFSDTPLIYTLYELESKSKFIVKRLIKEEETFYGGMIRRRVTFDDFIKSINKITYSDILHYISNILEYPPRMTIGYRVPNKGISFNYNLKNSSDENEYLLIVSNNSTDKLEYSVSLINKASGEAKMYTFDTAYKLKIMLIEIYKENELEEM